MSGEIKIDVHGMLVQWVGNRDTPALRGKLRGEGGRKCRCRKCLLHRCPCSLKCRLHQVRLTAPVAQGLIQVAQGLMH
jgi:hypothetical protein